MESGFIMQEDPIIVEEMVIIIPTKNHAEIIEHWLDVYISNSQSYRAKVYIIDSSDDDETRKVCALHSDFVFWERFPGYKNDSLKEMDDKVVLGFEKITSEYVWLTSDARIPNMDLCYNVLKNEMLQKRDVIHFFSLKSKMNASYVEKNLDREGVESIKNTDKACYNKTNLQEMFLDYFWSISTYGITVVRNSLIKNCSKETIIEKYSGLSFLYPAMIFENLSIQNDVNCIILNHGCFIANEKRIVNTWKASGDAVKVYSEHVVKIINKMPGYFDKYKEQVIAEFGNNNMHMTFKDSLVWRKEGYYNFCEFWKYKKYIKKVAEKKIFTMFLIAVIPCWICNILLKRQ